MKRIHIKKPDIKGFFTKVKNLKPEDIKRLQEQNFTVREIEILSKKPKSSVARELKEMSEDE